MHPRMAFSAQCDKVLFDVATRMAPEFGVVHLQVLRATASLTPPAVTLQHLETQLMVALGIESESRAFAVDLLHETFRLTSVRKASRCGPGKNL